MIVLGVAPPYTEEDINQAFRDKAKLVHPDHGGTAGEFHTLQTAYEKARANVAFRSNRRQWIANRMAEYLGTREVHDQIEQFGAQVTSNAVDWLEKSFGDFAQLTETITAVRLERSVRADELIRYMVTHSSELSGLTKLEFPGCKISDESVLQLEAFQQLRHLDLSDTPITKSALWIVDAVLNLEWVELTGTRVGWWMRRRVRKVLQKRVDAKPVTPFE